MKTVKAALNTNTRQNIVYESRENHVGSDNTPRSTRLLGQLSLASLRGRLIQYQFRLG